jgi:outer membrane autotransporter protein
MPGKNGWLQLQKKHWKHIPVLLNGMALLTLPALPAYAVDLSVTSGTFEVNGPGDVPEDRVVVDNSSDADATLQINAGATFSKVIILNNDGALINEGAILQTGVANNGAFGDVGMAHVTNRAGGTITVDDIGMWLKADGTVLNTGAGTSINGRIGISINGTADVTNELEAEINAGTGAGLYLNSGTVINRSGATITSDGAEGVRMAGTGSVTNTGEDSAISGGTLGVTILGAGSSLINEDGATIHGGTRGADVFGDITNRGAGSKISSNEDGIRTRGGATVRNEDGAEIEAEYLAVDMYDGGDVYNTDSSKIISNSTDGIAVWIYGSVTNSGEGSAITAGGYAGVYFNPFDAEDVVFRLTNSDKATIQADSYGIAFDDAAGVLVNEGNATITSVAGSGVAMNHSGSVTNRSGGEITGPVTGLYLRNDDSSFTFNVINTGEGSAITATGIDGVFDDADAIFITGTESSVTNSDNASISGLRYGTWLLDGGTLTNETGATINASGENGIGAILSDAGTLTNQTGATIFGTLRGVQSWGADITNTGADSAITSDGTAVQTWAGGGSVTNADGATMHGGKNGVLLDISSALENNGGATIIGDTDNGVLSYNGGSVTNAGTESLIQGGIAGIQLQGGLGTVNNTDGATISGNYAAIGLFEGGSVTNGIGATLTGGTFGVYVEGGAATVSNAGAIIGDVDLSGGFDNHVTLFTGGSIDGGLYVNNRTGSTLTFGGTGEQLLSDAVTGSFAFGGTLTKQGTGTWTIDKNLLANVTNVTDGTLIVGLDGTGILFSDVNVSLGATLGGSGHIYGNVVVDGTVTPGNSPGVLNVVGNYTQAAGSTFQAEIDTDTGLYDQIIATGNATIDPGAILNITRTGNASYTVGTQYTFLTATGVTGSYTVTGDLVISPFLTLSDHYTPSTGYLEVVQTASLAAAISTPSTNLTNLVNGVQSNPASPINNALLNLPSLAAVNAALQQLTGEIHPSMAGAMMEDSRLMRNAARARLLDTDCPAGDQPGIACDTEKLTLWSSMIGGWGHNNGTVDSASMSHGLGAMLIGADMTLNKFWRVGGFAGYGQSHFEVNDRNSSATSNDYHLGFYLGSLPDIPGLPTDLALRFGGISTWHDIDTKRPVNFPGLYNRLEANYRANTRQIFAEIAYRLHDEAQWVEPFINWTYVAHRQAQFAETGGAAALSAQGKSNGVALTTLGLNGFGAFSLADKAITGKTSIGWRHADGDTDPQAYFEIGGGSPYAIKGVPLPRNALVAETRLDMDLGPGMRLSLASDMQLARDATSIGARATLLLDF